MKLLIEADVEFVLVGGIAAIAMGSNRATFDVDVVYRRTSENITKIANCLQAFSPYLRGAPAGLPFKLDAVTIENGMNFTLVTDLGDLDLLGQVIGGGVFEELLPDTQIIEVFGCSCRSVTLDKLIELKRACGRPKDLEALSELESLRDLEN